MKLSQSTVTVSHDLFWFHICLPKWREFFKPITKRGNAKPKKKQVTFDTEVKTALYDRLIWTIQQIKLFVGVVIYEVVVIVFPCSYFSIV